MSDAETLSVYATKARDYADLVRTAKADPDLQRFIAALNPGNVTLDIGCGPGFAAAAMAAANLTAHAWDPVPEMLAIAATHPGVHTRRAGYGDLTTNQSYHGIWANFSMLHTPLADWPDQFTRIARALKPRGVFHFGTKLGQGESRDKIGRLYSYVTEVELTDLLDSAGFTLTHGRTGQEAGLSGEIAPFIVVQATKAAQHA